nr:hypothetical protein [Candidatus Brachybacter algidus]
MVPGDGCTSTADPIGYASFGGTSCATPHVTGASCVDVCSVHMRA